MLKEHRLHSDLLINNKYLKEMRCINVKKKYAITMSSHLQQRYCSIKGSTCTLHHDIPEPYCVRLFAGVRACNNTWA